MIMKCWSYSFVSAVFTTIYIYIYIYIYAYICVNVCVCDRERERERERESEWLSVCVCASIKFFSLLTYQLQSVLIYLSIYVSIYLSIYLSVCVCVCVYVYNMSATIILIFIYYLLQYVPIDLSHFYSFLSIYKYIFQSLSFFLSFNFSYLLFLS